MKIYDFAQAPNPRRLRVFLAEKGIKVPYEQVCNLKGRMLDWIEANLPVERASA